MITADILGFFFLLYLINVKYPGNKEEVKKVFKGLFTEILSVFGAVIEGKCLESYRFLENYCGVSLKRVGQNHQLIFNFSNEEEAKIYARVLSECRTYDSNDLLKFGIDPDDPATLGGQINLFLKSDEIRWGIIGKSVEIKIGTD